MPSPACVCCATPNSLIVCGAAHGQRSEHGSNVLYRAVQVLLCTSLPCAHLQPSTRPSCGHCRPACPHAQTRHVVHSGESELGWQGCFAGQSFGCQLTTLAFFAGGKIEQQKSITSISGAVLSGRYSYRSTVKVWQAVNVGKAPSTPDNPVISRAAHGPYSGLCLGVVAKH